MSLSPKELGGRTPLVVRTGQTIPRWGGLNRQDDPSAIADYEFTRLINIRNEGSKLIDRPGLTKLHTTALDGEVRGFYDSLLSGIGGDPELQETAAATACVTATGYGTTGSRIYFIGVDPCDSAFCLYHFAFDQSPKLQKLKLKNDRLTGGVLHTAANAIYSDGDRIVLATALANFGTKVLITLYASGSRHLNAPPTPLVEFFKTATGGDNQGYPTSGSATFLKDLFVTNSASLGGATNTELNIWKFDGRSVTEDDEILIGLTSPDGSESHHLTLIPYHESLLATVCYYRPNTAAQQNFPNKVRVRTTAGAWSNVALPGTVSKFGASVGKMVVYNDKAYIFGFGVMPGVHATNEGGIVLSYDGTSLAVAQNTISGAGSVDCFTLRDPVVFGGYIYYLHRAQASGTTVYVGRYDGSTWNNTYKNLTAQFTVAADEDVRSLDVFQGRLVAGIYQGASTTTKIVASPGEAVNGTWTTEASALTASLANGIFQSYSYGAVYGFQRAVL